MALYEVSVRDSTGRTQTYGMQAESVDAAKEAFRKEIRWTVAEFNERFLSCTEVAIQGTYYRFEMKIVAKGTNRPLLVDLGKALLTFLRLAGVNVDFTETGFQINEDPPA